MNAPIPIIPPSPLQPGQTGEESLYGDKTYTDHGWAGARMSHEFSTAVAATARPLTVVQLAPAATAGKQKDPALGAEKQ